MRIEDEIKTNNFRSIKDKAFLSLLVTANRINANQVDFFKEFDLTPQQYNILRILRGSSPEHMVVNEIKSRMLDKTPNTTRLVDKLLGKKLVSRDRCVEDRRVVKIFITEKGLDLLTIIDQKIESTTFAIDCLSDNEAETLFNLLEKIRG